MSDILERIAQQIDPESVRDLLDEVGTKNTVRVTKHAACSQPFGPKRHRKVFDEQFADGTVLTPQLVRQDELRAACGRKPIYLPEAIKRCGGELVSVTFNLRTNVGIDFVATQLGSTSPTTQADYIAVSNNNAGASATHASSTVPWSSAQSSDGAASGTTGEYTVLGVIRNQATYAH